VSPVAAHGIFTTEWHWIMTSLSPIFCFGFIYLSHFALYFLFYLPNFAHVDVLLCLAAAPVRVLSLTYRLSQSCTDYHTSTPSQLLASTLLAGTTLLRTDNRPYSSLYKLLIGTTGFLVGFLTLEDETDRSYRNVGKKLQLFAA
jgi:hypothetical protein